MTPGDDVGIDAATERRPAVSADQVPPHVERIQRAFADALASHGTEMREAVYAFAGRPVRLRVVGTRLAERIHRAFAHLRRNGATEEGSTLRIDLWDETEIGVRCSLDAASMDLDRQWIACGGKLAATPDGRYVSFRFEDSVTVLDRHAQRMIGCRRNGSPLSGGEYSKPLVLMLSIWFHDRGVQILHAGLIAHSGAGVLLPGESGSGKSTTSLASVAQGLEYLADDFAGLERAGDGTFVGHSVFNTACLVRGNLGRFSDIQPHAVEDNVLAEEKPILFLSEIYPDRLRATVPIRAVALLRIGYERTEIRRARRSEALRQFAASTLHTVVPRPGREALQMIGALVERVPAYWLLLGPDIQDVAPSIDQILSSGGGQDGS